MFHKLFFFFPPLEKMVCLFLWSNMNFFHGVNSYLDLSYVVHVVLINGQVLLLLILFYYFIHFRKFPSRFWKYPHDYICHRL